MSCAGEHPDPKKDLQPRILEATEYAAGGGIYLIPELRTKERQNRVGTAVFVFKTPDGKTVYVPAGSEVTCIRVEAPMGKPG